jgi:mannitol 2-dehydrogenase
MTPADYLALIERRFANPAIRDTTRRVAFDGSSRHTGFLLPILRDALAHGGRVEGLALVEALWARMCAGEREDGSQIEANDPNWTQLNSVAQAARQQPRLWLEQAAIYAELRGQEQFASAFEGWLLRIWETGTEAAMTDYILGR